MSMRRSPAVRLAAAAAFAALLAQCGAPQANDTPASGTSGEPQWIALFDGESLTGWTPKIKGLPLGEDPLRTFRVEDGLLCVAYDGYTSFDERFGHLFYATPFSHYLLRATYRFVGEQVPGAPGWAYRNSGFMLLGQSAASMTLDQSFPVSIEAQLLGASATDEGERSTANLCTPGTNVVMGDALVTQHCLESTSRTFRGEQWVTVEFEVRGNGDVVHRVEGEEVMRYRHAQLDPNDADAQRVMAAGDAAMTLDGLQIGGGTISVQSESHAIQFKSIELLPLVP
jgi:hypothetical protein